MKSYPTKGWAIIGRSARNESPYYDVHPIKRDAIYAFISRWDDEEEGRRIFKERVRDGSIRVARVKIVIDEDHPPKKPVKKEVNK